MNNMFDINQKIFVIFGGTGELFGKLAIELSLLGSNVIIIGRSQEKANIICNQGKNIKFLKFDAYNDDLNDIFNKIFDIHNKIDVLINGMGVNSSTPFQQVDENEINNIFKINYNIPSLSCSLVIDSMIKNKGGVVINVGSISGLTPLSKVYNYSASKAALHNLTKNLAREYGKFNVRFNILVPGFFPAEQNKKILTDDRIKTIMDHTPMNRFGEPNDLVGTIVLLSSDAGKFINGAELVIDGGFNATKI